MSDNDWRMSGLVSLKRNANHTVLNLFWIIKDFGNL